MRSLRKNLVLIFLILSIVPVLIINGLQFFSSKLILSDQLITRLDNTAESRLNILNHHLEMVERMGKFMSETTELRDYANQISQGAVSESTRLKTETFLQTYQETNWGVYHHIMLADRSGDIVVSPYHDKPNNNHLGQNIASSQFFKEALERPVITDFFGFEEKDHFHQLHMHPIKDNNGRVALVLVFEIEISFLNDVMQNRVSGEDRQDAYLSTLDRVRVVRNRENLKGAVTHSGIDQAARTGKAVGHFDLSDGRSVFGAYVKDKKYPWVMAVEVDDSVIMESVLQRLLDSVIITGIVFSLLFFMLLAGIRWLMKPVKTLIDQFMNLSEGDADLTSKIEIKYKIKEINDMTGYMNRFLERIGELVSEIQRTCSVTFSSTRAMEEDSNRFRDTAKELAAAIEFASDYLNKLTTSVENIAKHVESQNTNMDDNMSDISNLSDSIVSINTSMKELRSISVNTSNLAREGESRIKDVTAAMNEIRESSSHISDIVGIINEISDQTNLLSLNASIEAARAGEEGRGFAVVAQEISRLADKTVDSVQEIRDHVEKTEQSVANGSRIVGEAAVKLIEVSKSIEGMDGLVQSITHTVENQTSRTAAVRSRTGVISKMAEEIRNISIEQNKMTIEINDSIRKISKRMKTFSAISDEVAELAQESSETHTRLHGLVGRFKV